MSTALVTGASRGIGAACALALATAGYDVGVGYVSDQAGATATAEAIEALGRRAHVVQGDISDSAAAEAMVTGTEEALGPLDALVLNAGITRDGLMMRMTDDDWDAVIGTNLSGSFFTARAALRGMMKRRSGSIVAISSVVGMMGNAGQVNYAAAKAGATTPMGAQAEAMYALFDRLGFGGKDFSAVLQLLRGRLGDLS